MGRGRVVLAVHVAAAIVVIHSVMNPARHGAEARRARSGGSSSSSRRGSSAAWQHLDGTAYPALLHWLQDNGVASVDDVDITLDDDCRGAGIVARRDVPVLAPVLSVPGHLLLSLATADVQTIPLAQLLASGELSDQPELQLALLLLYHKSIGAASFWAPYLATLPEHGRLPCALGMSPLELQLLRSLNATVSQAGGVDPAQQAGMPEWLDVMYDARVLPLLARLGDEVFPTWSSGGWSKDHLRWAVCMVLSRAFRVPSAAAGEPDELVLAPLIDLANHGTSHALAGFPRHSDRSEFQLVPAQGARRGIPVLNNYGQHVNEILLHQYGFVLDDNPHWTLPLYLHLPGCIPEADDTLLTRRRSALLKHLLPDAVPHGLTWLADTPPLQVSDVLIMLRICTLISVDEVERAAQALPRHQPISYQADVRAYQQLRDAVANAHVATHNVLHRCHDNRDAVDPAIVRLVALRLEALARVEAMLAKLETGWSHRLRFGSSATLPMLAMSLLAPALMYCAICRGSDTSAAAGRPVAVASRAARRKNR